MPHPPEISDDLRLVMARAFDKAWDRFARPRMVIDAETMRSALAQHIVAMVRDGETDEGRLSASGFLQLSALRGRNSARSPRPR
jgi:hypothetical protein